MDGFAVGAASALWLGILTSMSPCPLATNIAAVSYVASRGANSRAALTSGVLYTLGRMLAYLVVGVLVIASIFSIPDLSNALQKYMNQLLGPVLILSGLALLEVVRLPVGRSGRGQRLQRVAESGGSWGALLIGFAFAMTFCPVSAALFFGSLVPLALKSGSSIVYPSLFGIGTGLPVLLFAVLIALGARSLDRWFKRLTQLDWWARRATGVVFILVGMDYALTYVWRVSL